jgi:hypothetical protein
MALSTRATLLFGVCGYPNATLAVFLGPNRLAEYDAIGSLVHQQPKAA